MEDYLELKLIAIFRLGYHLEFNYGTKLRARTGRSGITKEQLYQYVDAAFPCIADGITTDPAVADELEVTPAFIREYLTEMCKEITEETVNRAYERLSKGKIGTY